MRDRVLSSVLLLAGVAGVLVPVTLFLGVVFALQAAPWFSWTMNAISDLGIAPGSCLLFNGTMVCTGVLLFLFSIGIRLRVSRIGGMVLGLAAVLLVGVGFVPESIYWVHWLISVSFFLLLVGIFLFLWLHPSVRDKVFVKSSRGVSCIAMVATGWFWLFPGAAIPEICVLAPAFLWCAGVGAKTFILPALSEKRTRRHKTPAVSG